MLWIKWGLLSLGVTVLVASLLQMYGSSRWQQRTQQLVARLDRGRQTLAGKPFDPHSLSELPAPVQTYLKRVLRPGQPLILAAQVRHQGHFNLSEQGERWVPFTSAQWVVTQRPGFVWDAQMALMPGLKVHVHDAYIAGEGILQPTLAGLISLFDMRGSGAVAAGELLRFLAEAPWYPTALLPSANLRWEAVDASSARAYLQDGPLQVSLMYRFNGEGLIESVRADARGRTQGKQVIPTPWEGRWYDYREQGGMLVPFSGEVAWLLPEGRQTYWRGTISALSYDFAP